MPRSGLCVIRGRRLSLLIEQRSKDHANGMAPRVAPWIAERADLFELYSIEASFFVQLPSGGCLKRFVFFDKPARKSPATFKRFMFALDEQDSNAAV